MESKVVLALSKQEAQYLIDSLDLVVRNKGLGAAGQALSLASKIQRAASEEEPQTEEESE